MTILLNILLPTSLFGTAGGVSEAALVDQRPSRRARATISGNAGRS
ncbi:MAG: hypothetical protein NFW04_04715 [Candidatus Accumulibacter sp.]|nr:hypothetical protein [Accumulibacter sp.]MCM8597947.1 hypothetical protein [Accumulibacter sp.]MCM8661591.1 hypothetical protein [Accumulibacter sp.]HNC22282.1 hypothetical protein [Accumulibacter sp.]